ncbi:MAG TPA: class I SAM-dependent methyltransferase [Chthonomonadaceae bacterium]|nr:class I SAM-dependent methyltransferase [Chthonomonadaceae bacterium]
MHLTEACDPEFERFFSQAGITTVRVPAFDPRHPHSNKLAQLNTGRLQEADLVVLSDCDVAFCHDIPEILADTEAVRAKPVDNSNLSPEQWKAIYAQAGFPPPELTAAATVDRQPIPPLYLNGGLYVLPQKIFESLRTVWPKWNRWMLDRSALLEPFAVYADQVSFALSLQEIGCPVHPLSMTYNCPTHLPFPEGFRIEEPPKVLHYHSHLTSSGLLLPTTLEAVNRSIETVNNLIREERKKRFDNYVFWQFRYAFAPDAGSGEGSRGDNLLVKRNLLRTEIKRLCPQSILDVGCGDLQIVGPMVVIDNYTGVDISASAIERARQIRPEWSFLVGDVTTLEIEPRDLVLCLDVVIHQPTADLYERFCRRLLELSRHHLIVAGYNQPPWFTSEITFYYEPLSETLKRLGSEGFLQIIGGYRDTTVLLWTRPGAPEPLSYAQATAPPPPPPSPLWRRALRRVRRILGGPARRQ